MRNRINPILDRIGLGLEQELAPLTKEPLPKRWVELIHYLNEREKRSGSDKPHDDQTRLG